MNRTKKTWSIIAAVATRGVAIAAFTFAGPLAEAGVKFN